MKFTNNNELPLSLAVFLAHDEYPEHNADTLSATTLIKPIKEIILGMRLKTVPGYEKTEEISSRMSSAFGTAIHNGVEAAWCSKRLPETLLALGYPPGLVKAIKVNPSPEEAGEYIDIYTEYRTSKKLLGWNISGEFDFLADGRIRDIKSTGTYTWIKQTNAEKYIKQMSIYRWLNPEKVTDDLGAIDYVFTDWSALAARTQADYPKFRMMEQLYPLMSYDDTEAYLRHKVQQINDLRFAEEGDIPMCTNEDLWVDPSTFRYYKDPAEAKRATATCDSLAEAQEVQREYTQKAQEKLNTFAAKPKLTVKQSEEYQKLLATFDPTTGLAGAIVERKGMVKACKYCDAQAICKQAEHYVNTGELQL